MAVETICSHEGIQGIPFATLLLMWDFPSIWRHHGEITLASQFGCPTGSKPTNYLIIVGTGNG
jgi:hypothetical protein